jgi:arylsulfatase
MAYTWTEPEAVSHRTTQYYELYGRRGLQHGPWKAIARHIKGQPFESDEWELYHTDDDFAEARNVAGQYTSKLDELKSLWEREAQSYNVFPLDDSTFERDLLRPPELGGNRSHFVYYPPLEGIHKGSAPDLRGRSFTLRASIERDSATAGGVIAAQGGWFCGFALWVHEGRLSFDYNVSGLERTRILSTEAVPTGKSDVSVELNLGHPPSRSAEVTLRIDGREVGRGTLPRAMPGMISHEPLDLGRDTQTAVTDAYSPPNAFQGRIERVEFTLVPKNQR